MKSTVDSKGMMSSLSADAAEFVPQSDLQKQASPGTSKLQPKALNSTEVTEVPRYLTSCFPFVSPEDVSRQHMSRFPQQFSYTGDTPPSMPMSFTPPIRFPTWQAFKPGLVGNFQPVSYTSVPFDQLTVPVDVPGVRGDCLLLTQSKIGMSGPPALGQGVLVTPHRDPVTSWIMSMPPPPVILEQPQYQHHVQQQHVTVPAAAAATTYLNVPHRPAKDDKLKVRTDSVTQKVVELEARPPSPVLISRSTQTDIPASIRNFTLEEKPHPLYVGQTRGSEAVTKQDGSFYESHESKEDNDSDSGYNSPMQKQNLVSNGTQAVPSGMSPDTRHTEEGHDNVKSQKIHGYAYINQDTKTGAKGRIDGKQSPRLNVGSPLTEKVEWDEKKKRRWRDMTRSPKALGSYTKALSRSSSSVSSAGTKPEDEDEKIDLHSWTDFPPMSTRVPATSRPMHNKSPLTSDERVPLTIERSAHEPPWSIKFSSADQTRSERSRSSSGEKDKSIMSPPDSVWGKIGRTFKNSQAGVDIVSLTSNPETVPLVISYEKNSDICVQGNASLNKLGPQATNKSKNFINRTNNVNTDLRDHQQSSIQTKSKHENYDGERVRVKSPKKVDQSNSTTSHSTPVAKKKLSSALAVHSSVALFSRPPPSTVMAAATTASNVCFSGAIAASSNSATPTGPATQNQPALSSPIFAFSLQQSASFSNLGIVPPLPIRSGLQNAPPSVNYHIPPPAQIPYSAVVDGGSHANPKFSSYLQVTQMPLPVRTPSPVFLSHGAANQASQSTAPPHQNNCAPFIPPPSTFALSAPFSYYTGVAPSYQLNSPGIISGSAEHSTELISHPQVSSAAKVPNCSQSSKGTNLGLTSVAQTVIHRVNSASPVCSNNSVSKTDIRTITADTASNEQKSLNNAVGALNSKDVEGEERRRKRRRRKRTKHNGKEVTEDGNDGVEKAGSNISEPVLHFEDMDEFPDLLHPSSVSAHNEDIYAAGERSALSGASVTYSDILKSAFSKAGSQSRTQSLTGSCVSGDIDDEDNASCQTGTTNESKRARRRRKRREQANKAAEAELAEISLEQQWLKELGLKKSSNHRTDKAGGASVVNGKSMPGLITQSSVVNEAKKQTSGKGGNKKSQQPIAFDIAAMIDAIQKKPEPTPASSLTKSQAAAQIAKASKKQWDRASTASSSTAGNLGNILDSTAPAQKRGKEREVAKAKKPSPLKKVILKEREQRKRLRLLDEDPDSATALGTVGSSTGVGIVGGESELSQDALSNKSEGTDVEGANETAELSADFSPISQTSPISMSPASPGNSGVNSPVTGSIGRDPVVMKIHSRRFREYCTQILDKEIDECCMSLLQDLVKFQDRMYHKDPAKAKTKRRVVLGLREVTKHLKLKKIKCVVISPNLEKIQSKGGLDEALNNILNMCREQDVPFVFALGRRALGRACAKLVPVSVVGIFNYEGCENKYRSLISLTAAARAAYNEMVLAVEKEVAEYPTMASQTSSIGGVPGLFAAHMGHSRTPSGCSAISFTSSILSEPISENFPHAEPEVDSKGYEIVRDAAGNVVHPFGGAGAKGCLAVDIDDGNEADTEDFGETRKKRRGGRPLNSVRFGDMGAIIGSSDRAVIDFIKKEKGGSVSADGASDADDRSTIGKLSRNVSELTLTNEENFILKGEPYYLKHKSCLRDFEDDNEGLDAEKAGSADEHAEEAGGEDEIHNRSVGLDKNKWVAVSHIDSIHSHNYNLGNEILSQHQDTAGIRSHSISSSRHSQSSPSHPSTASVRHRGQGLDLNDEDNIENNDDEIEIAEEEVEEEEVEEEDEEENEAAERHHRVIDKERIKNWLESQSNISTDD